jgi:hypothetical protein
MVSENSSETKNDKLVVNKHRVSNAETKNQTKATLHYDLSEDHHFMNLTLYAVGACVQVFKIRVYYYVCPTNETLMVIKTAAPSSGFNEASANCVQSSKSEKRDLWWWQGVVVMVNGVRWRIKRVVVRMIVVRVLSLLIIHAQFVKKTISRRTEGRMLAFLVPKIL